MDPRKIDENITVSSQIRPDDVAELARAGFRAIICNRPDGEDEGQPAAQDIRTAAEAAGLAFHHIPTVSGQFPEEAVAAFRAARQSAGGPVFAYCRSGTRCATLDALANPDGKPAEEIIADARAAGYDLAPHRARIEAGG